MSAMRLSIMLLFILGALFIVSKQVPPDTSLDGPSDTSPEAEISQQVFYPELVMETIETVKPLRLGMTVVDGGETFVIVSYGEQPTEGYQVNIQKKTTEDQLVITAELIEPEETAAQVITYPYAVEVLEEAYDNVKFQDANGEHFPQVVGWQGPGPLKALARSNNIVVSSLDTAPDLIRATGIARVFEATVSYELQDAAGTVLQRGFTTAASGGPDWGYFEVKVDDPPVEVHKLLLFQESAKDGSSVDVVEIIL